MNHWIFLFFLFLAALVMTIADHALMVFQIRTQIGIAPMAAMYIGSMFDWMSRLLVAVAVVSIMRTRRSD